MYFPVDDTLSVVKHTSILPTASGGELVAGMTCKVKERSKTYDARVIAIGKAFLIAVLLPVLSCLVALS